MCLVSNVTVSTAPGAALGGHGGPATRRAGWGSSWTGEAVLSLRLQQLKILRAIVTSNKATGVFSALSRSPSALPPSREVLCPLHPGTALQRVGRGLPPAPGCSHCASVSLCLSFPPAHCAMVPPSIPLLSSNFFHSTKSPELPHSSPSHPRCLLPLMSARGHMALRTAISIQAAPVQPRQLEGNSRDWKP